jgi:hypothetical protein
MKRFFCLALTLLVSLCILCSCGAPAAGTTGTSATTVATTVPVPVIPEGYTKYSNGDMSFAYPSDWVKTDGSIVILSDKTNSNNITVAYEAKTDMYDTFTVADFNSMIKPAYEAMGMSVSNVKIEHKTVNGEKINVFSFTNVTSGRTMTQTQYIFNAGTRTYVVTVTETTRDTTLVKTVIDTIKILK